MILPYRPESQEQNLIVIKAFPEAAKRYARGGYDVAVAGIAGPWFLKPWIEAVRAENVTFLMKDGLLRMSVFIGYFDEVHGRKSVLKCEGICQCEVWRMLFHADMVCC